MRGTAAEPTRLPIVAAVEADAEWLLKLQYLCYQGEAARYQAWTLGALTQTLASLQHELRTCSVLVARIEDEVVGSVRGHLEGDTFHVGRLVVHPRVQRRGLGTRLLAEIERYADPALRCEVFTGSMSAEFRAVYRKAGYEECRRLDVNPALQLVYFDKLHTPSIPSGADS